MVTVDAGSPLLVEVQFSKAEPFKGYKTFDPTTYDYETYGPDGELVAEDTASGSLTKVTSDVADAGRYYCVIKTSEEWPNGDYKVKIISSHGTSPNVISDIDIKESIFTLRNSTI